MPACFVSPNPVVNGANVDPPRMADFRKYLEERFVSNAHQVASAKAIWRDYIADIELQTVAAAPKKPKTPKTPKGRQKGDDLENILGIYRRQFPAKISTATAVLSVMDSIVQALAVAGGEEKEERQAIKPSNTLQFSDEVNQSFTLSSTGISPTLPEIRSAMRMRYTK